MQPVRPTATGHRASGELVDDDDLTIFDNVLDITLIDSMRAQRGIEMMQQADIRRVVEAFAFVEQSGPDHQCLDFFLPLLGHVGLLGFFVKRIVAALDQPAGRALSPGLDEHDIGPTCFRDLDRLL